MTKGKIKILSCVAAAVIAVSAIAGSYAWYLSSKKEITNTLTAANVDISMQEIEWKDENGEQFRIGDTVLKNPTVTANDGDVYLKVIMHIKDKDGNEVPNIIASMLKLFMYYDPDGKLEPGKSYTVSEINSMGLDRYNPDFVLSGNTFYLQDSNDKYTVLHDGESKELFTTICVPKDRIKKEVWLKRLAPLENFTISFEVKAVLADNIEDIENANPDLIDSVLDS